MTRKEEREHAAYDFVYTDSETVENHILGFNFFTMGARWADRTMLDKVCDYLKKLVYQEYPGGPSERMISDECLEELRKAMEE